MNTQELRKQIKNNEMIKLNDGSKVMVSNVGKNKYMASFEKFNYETYTFKSLKETIEFVVSINNK